MITGIDIVERQLRIAAGETTPIRIPRHTRTLYPSAASTPKTPTPSSRRPEPFEQFHIPHLDGLRVDTGFRAGDEVSSYFDPLLAKAISWAETRESAIALMRRALDQTQISGLKTNVPTLRAALGSPEFESGRYTTNLLTSLAAS